MSRHDCRKKYEQLTPVLSHTGCKELIWFPSGFPFKAPQAQRSLPRGLPPQRCSPQPAAPCCCLGALPREKLKSEGSGWFRDLFNGPPGSADAPGESGCPMGHRSENRVTLGREPTHQKATEFGRGMGPANGVEALGSQVGSEHRPSSIPSTALLQLPRKE